MNKVVWLSLVMVWSILIYASTVVSDLRKELREVKETQERQILKYHFDKFGADDARMRDYCRLIHAIGEVYGLTTADEICRLICWSATITHGMPFAQRRLRTRKGPDGDHLQEAKTRAPC